MKFFHLPALETSGVPRSLHWAMMAFAAFFLTGLTGCIELDQNIVIRADGGARFVFHYSVPLASYPLLVESQEIIQEWQAVNSIPPDSTGLNWFFNEELAREYFSGPNLQLEEFKITETAERRHVALTCEVRNLKQALEQGKLGDFKLTETASGNHRFSAELIGRPPDTTELSQEKKELLREITRGLIIQFEIETPTPIIDTSGIRKGERRVTWQFNADVNDWFLFIPPEIFVTFPR